MNIKIDHEEFAARQATLIRILAAGIREQLQAMVLGEDQELMESLLFEIGSILDGSRESVVAGKRLRPFLTFADDQTGAKLVAAKGGSWIHEVCHAILKDTNEDEPSS